MARKKPKIPSHVESSLKSREGQPHSPGTPSSVVFTLLLLLLALILWRPVTIEYPCKDRIFYKKGKPVFNINAGEIISVMAIPTGTRLEASLPQGTQFGILYHVNMVPKK